MNKNELTVAIKNLAVVSRALDQLLRMSPDDVDRVLHLLSDPKAVEDVRRLLKTVREIRRGPTIEPGPSVPGEYKAEALGLEVALDDLFADRDRFPTIASISQFVADVFKVKVTAMKDSRARYIRKVVRAIKGSRKALYHARNALAHGEMDRKDRAYGLLYDFIRGRLTD